MVALALFVALCLVVGLIGGIVLAATRSRTDKVAPDVTLPTVAPATDGGQSIEQFIPVAKAFIEEHRGLTFLSEPKVTLLDDKAFQKKLLDDEESDQAQIAKATKVLRALGLIEGDVDLNKALDALLGGAVVGFYDPKTKELFVRGAQLTPYVRQVLVHELTHAVQDQHFAIDRPELDDADDERSQAFSALVEGDAVRIDTEYRSSLSRTEQKQAEDEESNQGGSIDVDIPPVLIDQLIFPYQVGPAFTEAVVRARGQAALDEAFRTPPTTSEQILHPDTFLAAQGAVPVDEPKPDGGAKVLDKGVLGEFGLLELLRPAIEKGTLGEAQAVQAAAGWGGDRYVAWEANRRTCVRATIAMDTPKDTTELLGGLQKLGALRTGLTLSGNGPVTVTSCG